MLQFSERLYLSLLAATVSRSSLLWEATPEVNDPDRHRHPLGGLEVSVPAISAIASSALSCAVQSSYL
eukprot:3406940-Pyramimonas_sp.AAC.1